MSISMQAACIPRIASREAIREIIANPLHPTLVDWLSFATIEACVADRSGMTNPGPHCYKGCVAQEKCEMGSFPAANFAGQVLIHVASVHG
jgi:hypothetical protein